MINTKTDTLSEVFADGTRHLKIIATRADQNQIVWTTLQTPKPDAMRAFQGITPGYMLNITQANTVEHGIVTEGMAVCPGMLVLRLPPVLAAKLYRQATQQRN